MYYSINIRLCINLFYHGDDRTWLEQFHVINKYTY